MAYDVLPTSSNSALLCPVCFTSFSLPTQRSSYNTWSCLVHDLGTGGADLLPPSSVGCQPLMATDSTRLTRSFICALATSLSPGGGPDAHWQLMHQGLIQSPVRARSPPTRCCCFTSGSRISSMEALVASV